MQNLTEFNTAHNRRITSITGGGELEHPRAPLGKMVRPDQHLRFVEDVEVINPGTPRDSLLFF